MKSRNQGANKITGANAGGPPRLPMRTRWAARTAQFCLGRVDGPRVPYAACFHITTVSAGTNQTKVVVRTIVSEVVDGKEPGVHAQWAFHYRKVPPVRQEEENVIAALSGKLIPGK